MAALTTAEISHGSQRLPAGLADLAKTIGTQALRAAYGTSGIWADSNQASFVASLPEPFKSSSTAEQKAALLAIVLGKKYL